MMPSDLHSSGARRPPTTGYQPLNPRRRPGLRVAVLLVLAAAVLYLIPSFTPLPFFPSSREDYTETVRNIREMRAELADVFPKEIFNYRPVTLAALDRLATCLETNECGPGEKTVIILGSYHFGNSQSGHTSGEDIWAASLITTLKLHNYTLLYTFETLESLLVYKALGDMIPLVFMEGAELDQCLEINAMSYADAIAAKPKIAGLKNADPEQQLGCIKRVGFEEGIPLHKIRAFHFWLGVRHPLRGWTLSPENYSGWWGDSGNYYLGYHLEHCRHVPAALDHEPRAFILGKKPSYFAPEKYAWPQNILEELTQEIGGGFEFVGAAGKAGVDEMPIGGIRNLGAMQKEEWSHQVAKSAVMLGVGNPPLSPSPYDAWCLGVPFINPIIKRDEKKPEDRHMWLSQHAALKVFDEPYVYHVWHNDAAGLKRAIEMALKTPFPPFIPERMKRESLDARLEHLIHHDWAEVVEGMIHNGTAEGYARPDSDWNMKDGFLL